MNTLSDQVTCSVGPFQQLIAPMCQVTRHHERVHHHAGHVRYILPLWAGKWFRGQGWGALVMQQLQEVKTLFQYSYISILYQFLNQFFWSRRTHSWRNTQEPLQGTLCEVLIDCLCTILESFEQIGVRGRCRKLQQPWFSSGNCSRAWM